LKLVSIQIHCLTPNSSATFYVVNVGLYFGYVLGGNRQIIMLLPHKLKIIDEPCFLNGWMNMNLSKMSLLLKKQRDRTINIFLLPTGVNCY